MKIEVDECDIVSVKLENEDNNPMVKLEIENDSKKCSPENDCESVVSKKKPKVKIMIQLEKVTEKATILPDSFYKSKVLTLDEVEKIRRKDLVAKRYVSSSFKCETCIVGYDIKTMWESHNKRLHSEKSGSHICCICQRRFKTEEILNNHYNAHLRCYACVLCDFAHPSLNVIRDHYSETHNKDGYQWRCNKCPTECLFPSRGKLKYHRKTVHQELPICPTANCHKTYKTKNALKYHMLQHDGSTPRLKCAICHKLLKGEDKMKAHMKTHTDPSPPPTDELLYCIPCDRQFTTRIQYDRHIKSSVAHLKREEFKFQCAQCAKRFVRQLELDEHVLQAHLNRRDFACDICDKRFNTVRLQKLHRKRHNAPEKVKNKVCDLCGKAFSLKKSLEEHMNVHTGARPFECKVCRDRFNYSAVLFTHNRLKHENFKQNSMKTKL